MTNRDLSELLEGLPHTAPTVVRAARAYDEAGDYRNAEALLRAALSRSSTPELRLASAEHLLARARWAAAYQQARHAMADPTLWQAAVAAARASHKLGEHGRAQSLLDDALDRGADLTLISAWRDHFAGLADPPAHGPAPTGAASPDQGAFELPDFTEEPTELVEELAPHEPTHLVHIPASLGEAPEARPGGRDPAPGFEPDETTLRRRRPRKLRPGAPGASTPVVDAMLADSPSEPTDVFMADPTLPPGADLAQELPRHESGRRNAPASMVAPRAAEPRSEGAAAKRRGAPEKPELELDLDALRSTHRQASGRTSSIRRLTHLVQTSLPEPLQSPARALFSVVISALLVLGLFATLGYVWQIHRATSASLNRAEAELHQDTYAAHARALEFARHAQSYTLLPSPADQAVRRLTDTLPGISTRAPVERAADLEALIRARTAFRFEHPGTIAPPQGPTPRTPAAIAARIYASAAWLPRAEIPDTVDHLVALAPASYWVRLAHAEVLAETSTAELATQVTAVLPPDTNARAFVHARHLLQIDEEAATTALRAIVEATPDHHSSRLTLARHLAGRSDDDLAELDALLATAARASSREIAPADRAALHMARADIAADETTRAEALVLAAEAAPLRPDRVQPLIDHLITHGQLLAAREQLIRTPSEQARHPYFDLALANLHLQIGDTDRAIARLNASSANPAERLLLALAMAAEGNLDIARSELGESPLDRAAAQLLNSPADDARIPEDDFDASAPFTTERALLDAATLTYHANRAESWEAQSSLRARATARLEHSADTPAKRLLACRLALDARDAELSATACARHEKLDAASRWAVDTLTRWHTLNDRHDMALRLIARHESLSGTHPRLALLRAEVELARGNPEAASSTMEPALGTPTSRSARWATLQGNIALAEGDQEQALAYFRAALQSQPDAPAAALGRLWTLLGKGPLEPDDERALRALLRDGAIGPRAWLAFARQRRLQGRHADATENLQLARRAANTLGERALEHALHTEEALARAERSGRAFADPAVARALERAAEFSPHSPDFHVASARVALAARRPDRALAARHLEDALKLASLRCELWPEVIDLRRRLRHPVAVRRLTQNIPSRCS